MRKSDSKLHIWQACRIERVIENERRRNRADQSKFRSDWFLKKLAMPMLLNHWTRLRFDSATWLRIKKTRRTLPAESRGITLTNFASCCGKAFLPQMKFPSLTTAEPRKETKQTFCNWIMLLTESKKERHNWKGRWWMPAPNFGCPHQISMVANYLFSHPELGRMFHPFRYLARVSQRYSRRESCVLANRAHQHHGSRLIVRHKVMRIHAESW